MIFIYLLLWSQTFTHIQFIVTEQKNTGINTYIWHCSVFIFYFISQINCWLTPGDDDNMAHFIVVVFCQRLSYHLCTFEIKLHNGFIMWPASIFFLFWNIKIFMIKWNKFIIKYMCAVNIIQIMLWPFSFNISQILSLFSVEFLFIVVGIH